MRQNDLEKKVAVVLGGTLVAAASIISPAYARDTKVGLGIGTSYEYYSRSYDNDQAVGNAEATAPPVETAAASLNDDQYNRLRLTPLVTLLSESSRDVLSLRYSPSLRYDDESSDHDVDHDLNATYTYSLTKDWKLLLGENYVFTDQNISNQTSQDVSNQTSQSSGGGELSDNQGRRKYWKNDLSLSSVYHYWEDSSVTMGYALGHLTHTDVLATSSYEDYVRHTVSLGGIHRLSSTWRLSADGSYSRGLFEQTENSGAAAQTGANGVAEDDNDLSEYRASTQLESSHFEHQLLTLRYGFTGVEYDDANLNATSLHDLTAGWQWQLAKDTSFYLGAGPSYNKVEEQEGNWGYNATARLRYTLERSTFEASLAHGYDVQNFTGTNERGLREYWQSRLDFSHQVIEDVSLKLFTFYRDEDQDEVSAQQAAATGGVTGAGEVEQAINYETTTFNRERLGLGTSIDYKFAHWYALGLSYNYLMQDSEKENDSYDEHRFVVSLSMEMDVFNW